MDDLMPRVLVALAKGDSNYLVGFRGRLSGFESSALPPPGIFPYLSYINKASNSSACKFMV